MIFTTRLKSSVEAATNNTTSQPPSSLGESIQSSGKGDASLPSGKRSSVASSSSGAAAPFDLGLFEATAGLRAGDPTFAGRRGDFAARFGEVAFNAGDAAFADRRGDAATRFGEAAFNA